MYSMHEGAVADGMEALNIDQKIYTSPAEAVI